MNNRRPSRPRRPKGGGKPRRKGPPPADAAIRSGKAEPVPRGLPATEFEKFDISPWIVKAIAAAGYIEPSPIQAQMIPLALDEHNVIGRSRTGTGKTAAFLVPLLALLEEVEDPEFIENGLPKGPVRILVVVPTRELAIQVAAESEKLTRFVPVRTVCCYGGTRVDSQARALKDAAVVVGTPGRLLDHIRRGNLDLSALDVVVLDEVDRMYDLGFRDDVDDILRFASNRIQTVLTSATLNEDVEALLEKHVGEHERIIIESKSMTVDEVDQTFYFVEPQRKQDLLMAIAADLDPERCIVFVKTRFSVDRITYHLKRRGTEAEMIHSGLPQRHRERMLEDFRQGRFPLLIATDVASRGLDIEGVTHVINFDMPQTSEDYVHRVGRTARMGQRGVAVSFVTSDDGALLTEIEKLINKQIRQEIFPGFEMPKPKEKAAKAKEKRPSALPPWANPARRRR